MSTKNSRDVLEWFRTWAQDRLNVIGRSDIGSNMNVPLTSDVRVQAAINYVEQVEAEMWAAWQMSWEPFWQTIGDGLTWSDDMPSSIANLWAEMSADPDPSVKRLVKSTIRMTGMTELSNAVG